jgi:hypothetical protein
VDGSESLSGGRAPDRTALPSHVWCRVRDLGDDVVATIGPGSQGSPLSVGGRRVDVRRDGHILEVAINRPCQQSLADGPGLSVAILAGAGNKADSAGNHLPWSAGGKPM